MTPIQIDDLGDVRLEPFRDLREAQRIKRDGLFIAEGQEVVRTASRSNRVRLRSVVISSRRLPGSSALLRGLADDVAVYVLEEALLFRVAGFPVHRGVLGCGEVPPPIGLPALLSALGSGPKRILVLQALADHDNVGAIYRSARAFGVDAVVLDASCADPWYRKSIRVSMGATLLLPTCRLERGETPFSALSAGGFRSLALTPQESAGAIRDVLSALGPRGKRLALCLGFEGSGLSSTWLEGADQRARIPMAPSADSLNVATAAAIALYLVAEHAEHSEHAGCVE